MTNFLFNGLKYSNQHVLKLLRLDFLFGRHKYKSITQNQEALKKKI